MNLAVASIVKELRTNSDAKGKNLETLVCFVVNSTITASLFDANYSTNVQRMNVEDLWERIHILQPVSRDGLKRIQRNFDISISRDVLINLQKCISALFQEYHFWDAFPLISEAVLFHISTDSNLMSKSSLGKFQTPAVLAKYILDKSLGKSLQQQNVDEILDIRIVDPASGSGVFVGIAYDMLLSYYRRMQKKLDERGLGDLSLSQIITHNNLHTVDISEGSIDNLSFGMRVRSLLFNDQPPHELPNLKIGNTLLDIPHRLYPSACRVPKQNEYDEINSKTHSWQVSEINIPSNLTIHFPEGEGPRFRPFLWQEEFRDVFIHRTNPGFDIVVGNPPYINIERLTREEYRFFSSRDPVTYKTARRRFDLFVLFLEKIITDLTRIGGRIGLVLPDKLLTESYSREIRRLILSKVQIHEIVDMRNWRVFPGVSARTIIFQASVKEPKASPFRVCVLKKDPLIWGMKDYHKSFVWQDAFKKMPNYMFRLRWDEFREALVNHIHSSSRFLADFCYVSWGAQPGHVERVIFQKTAGNCRNSKQSCPHGQDECCSVLCKKLVKGRDVRQYQITYHDRYLLYDWDLLNRPAFSQLFESEKVLVREVTGGRGLIAALDTNYYYTDHSLACIIAKKDLKGIPDDIANRRGIRFRLDENRPAGESNFLSDFVTFNQEEEVPSYIRGSTVYQDDIDSPFSLGALLAIINSSLICFYFREYLSGGLNVFPGHIKRLPIPGNLATSEKPTEIAVYIDRCARFLQSNKERNESINSDLLRAADRLVYDLFGISDDWIERIEKEAGTRDPIPGLKESYHVVESI